VSERLNYVAECLVPASMAHQKSRYLDSAIRIDLLRGGLGEISSAGAILTRRTALVAAIAHRRLISFGRRRGATCGRAGEADLGHGWGLELSLPNIWHTSRTQMSCAYAF